MIYQYSLLVQPQLPTLRGHVFINALSKLIVARRLVETGEFAAKLDTFNKAFFRFFCHQIS